MKMNLATIAKTSLGALAIQSSMSGAQGCGMCGKLGVLAGTGAAGLSIGLIPLLNMRSNMRSIDADIREIANAPNSTSVEQALSETNEDTETILNELDHLIQTLESTDFEALIDKHFPGSSNNTIDINPLFDGLQLCNPNNVNPSLSDTWQSAEKGWGGVINAIFGIATESVKINVCNLIGNIGYLVQGEESANNAANDIAVAIKDSIVGKLKTLTENTSSVKELTDNFPATVKQVVSKLEDTRKNINQLDIPLSGLAQSTNELSELLTHGTTINTVIAALSLIGGGAGVATGGAINGLAGDGVFTGVVTLGAEGLIGGMAAGLVTSPIMNTLNDMLDDLNVALKDENFEVINNILSDIGSLKDQLHSAFNMVSLVLSEQTWNNIKALLEEVTDPITLNQPLSDICDPLENSWASQWDSSISLVCNMMTSLLNMMEEQGLTKDFIDTASGITIPHLTNFMESVTKDIFEGSEFDSNNLSSSFERLMGNVELLTDTGSQLANATGLRKDDILENAEQLTSTAKWYLPVMVALIGGATVFAAVNALSQSFNGASQGAGTAESNSPV